MKIYKTSDYSKFKVVKGNRVVIESHVKNLQKSISENNLLEANPIIVNGNFEVIDGQHRLEAAKRMKIPVFYTVIEGGNLKEVQQLNAAQKKWTYSDFLDSHISLGNDEYVLIKLFCDTYALPVTVALSILSGTEGGGSSSIWREFKNGTFKIKSLKEAERIGNILMDLRKYAEPGVYRQRYFIRAVRQVYKGDKVSHERMMSKIVQIKDKIPHCATTKQYVRVLEDIYNFKAREGSITRLY